MSSRHICHQRMSSNKCVLNLNTINANNNNVIKCEPIVQNVYQLRTSLSKRSEGGASDGQSPQELSPLFKRIKKDNNNCLLIDSNECFIKQEFNRELDFNSRQPIVRLFSQMSIDRTVDGSDTVPTDMSSTATCGQTVEEANDLSESLNQMNISTNCTQTTQSVAKKKKNKKKKKKHKRGRKLRSKQKSSNHKNIVSKCVNNKTTNNSKVDVKSKPRSHQKHHLFSMRSSVVKELKVTVTEGMSAEEGQALIALRNDGVVRKVRKTVDLFKCLLCSHRFNDQQSAEEHISSASHLRSKSEQSYGKYDSLLALNLGQNHDIEVLLARKALLAAMSTRTKQQLYSNGIRVMDGFGANYLMCLECNNQPLESLSEAMDHMNRNSNHRMYRSLFNGFDSFAIDAKPVVMSAGEDEAFEPMIEPTIDIKANPRLSCDQKTKLFETEGIVRKIHKNSRKKKTKYFCLFCQKYFSTEDQVFKHIECTAHSRTKRGDNLKKVRHHFNSEYHVLNQLTTQ